MSTCKNLDRFTTRILAGLVGDYETLGGFLLNRMGRIPQKGESLKYGSIQYIVQDTDPKSIKEVMVVLPDEVET